MRRAGFSAVVVALLLQSACGGEGSPTDDGGARQQGSDAAPASNTAGANGASDGGGTSAAPRTGKVGAPCNDNSDCTVPQGAECFKGQTGPVNWPNGFCSLGCANSGGPDSDQEKVDCGPDASCASGSMSGGGGGVSFAFCAPACNKPEDCRIAEGYRCQIVFPGFPGYCAPP